MKMLIQWKRKSLRAGQTLHDQPCLGHSMLRGTENQVNYGNVQTVKSFPDGMVYGIVPDVHTTLSGSWIQYSGMSLLSLDGFQRHNCCWV